MLFSALGSYMMRLNGAFESQSLTASEQLPVALFSLLFSANIVVGNAALNYVSVSLVQVVRSVIPGLTLLLSMLLLGKQFDRIYYVVIALIVFGVAFASYGEVQFHFLGFICTLLVCFLSSLKSVTSQKFLVGKLKFHPFDLLLRMSWMAAVQMFVLALILEREDILNWCAKWRNDIDSGGPDQTTMFISLLVLNGTLVSKTIFCFVLFLVFVFCLFCFCSSCLSIVFPIFVFDFFCLFVDRRLC